MFGVERKWSTKQGLQPIACSTCVCVCAQLIPHCTMVIGVMKMSRREPRPSTIPSSSHQPYGAVMTKSAVARAVCDAFSFL